MLSRENWDQQSACLTLLFFVAEGNAQDKYKESGGV